MNLHETLNPNTLNPINPEQPYKTLQTLQSLELAAADRGSTSEPTPRTAFGRWAACRCSCTSKGLLGFSWEFFVGGFIGFVRVLRGLGVSGFYYGSVGVRVSRVYRVCRA